MKYKPTILNVSAIIFLAGILVYIILNYQKLSAEEGWGIVAMLGLSGIGLMAIIVDFFSS